MLGNCALAGRSLTVTPNPWSSLSASGRTWVAKRGPLQTSSSMLIECGIAMKVSRGRPATPKGLCCVQRQEATEQKRRVNLAKTGAPRVGSHVLSTSIWGEPEVREMSRSVFPTCLGLRSDRRAATSLVPLWRRWCVKGRFPALSCSVCSVSTRTEVDASRSECGALKSLISCDIGDSVEPFATACYPFLALGSITDPRSKARRSGWVRLQWDG